MKRYVISLNSKEMLRWTGSIGIFYVAVPAWIIGSKGVYSSLFSLIPNYHFSLPVKLAACVLMGIGLFFIYCSIRDQITKGAGHPFDLNGKGVLSRPTQVLLSDGCYYWSQNPMNFGDLVFYTGLSISFSSLSSLLINIPIYYIAVYLNHRFFERPSLIERFGQAYINYEKSTSHIIPGYRSILKFVKGKSFIRP